MRGKVDLTRILDLILTLILHRLMMGRSFSLCHFVINAGPVLVHAQSQWTTLRSDPSSIYNPAVFPSPIKPSSPGPIPLSQLESEVQRLSSLTNTCANKTKKWVGFYAFLE